MIGQVIGNYKIVEKIGEGGMGAVYRGVDTMLDREIAVKALRPELANNTSIVERFRAEAVTLAKLNHPNIAMLYSLLRQGDELFMILEYVRGETLDQILQRQGAISSQIAVPMFCQLLDGISYAHELGIVHRDIKPGNLMLTEKGILKVLDFGIARLLGSAHLTKAGNILGTLDYISPEQVRGLETDARSDIYALGITFYEILTGRVPFQADSEYALMTTQISQLPPPPRNFNASIPEAVEAAILRALAKNPDERFQNAGEFMDALLTAGFQMPKTTGRLFSMSGGYAAQTAPLTVEVQRLAEEAEARKVAEERANQLALAALEAQRLAEEERKKAEKEAQQREVEESVRRQDDSIALELTVQVSDAKQKYEEAKQIAEREAQLRLEVETKQQHIENELKSLAEREAERRRLVEAQAEAQQQQVQEQTSRFEKEALAAQQRIEEARRAAELEAQKREQAEAAQRRAEEEAKRLAQNISEIEKRIEELKQRVDSQPPKEIVQTPAPQPETNEAALPLPVKPTHIIKETLPAAQFHPVESLPILDKSIKETAVHREYPPPPKREPELESLPTTLVTNPEPALRLAPEKIVSGSDSVSPKSNYLLLSLVGSGVVLLLLVFVAGAYAILSFRISPNDGNLVASENKSAQLPANQRSEATPIPKNNSSNELAAGNRLASKMILIAGGNFQMGSNEVSPNDVRYGYQYPAYSTKVGSFYLDKTEVTIGDYAEFVRATNHRAPENWKSGNPPAGQENFPVTSVSLLDAKAYAEWISKQEKKQCRLPTEEEWEFAARNGSRQTKFPWGDDWRPDAANLATNELKDVGTTADETVVGGIKDMLGGVIEWTSSNFSHYPGHPNGRNLQKELFIVRGSSFGEYQDQLKNAHLMLARRQPLPADGKSPYLGFRLACQP